MTKQPLPYKKINRFLCTAVCVSALGLYLIPSRSAYGNAGQSQDFSNPVSGGPAISPTTPVSSYSPSTFSATPVPSARGNYIMTGNVGGLQYFHGSLPYTTQGAFMGKLESTSLDSFLRYSTPTSQTFYSRTASPQIPIFSGFAGSEKVRTPNLADQTAILQANSSITLAQTPTSALDISIPYSQQTGLLGRVSGYKSPEEFIAIQPQLQTTVPIVPDQTRKSLLDIIKSDKTADLSVPLTTNAPDDAKKAKAQPEKTTDTFDQIKTQMEQLNQQLDRPETKEAADQKIKEAIEQQWKEKISTASGESKPPSLPTPAGSPAQGQVQPGQPTPGSQTTIPQLTVPQLTIPQLTIPQLTVPQPTPQRPITPQPRSEQAPPKTGAAPASNAFARTEDAEKPFKEKANQYLSSAYKLLKEQNFYQAADDFTWASLYRPSDPNGYVGKAVALFAAGEYVSSSRLLAAGLNLSCDYAKTPLELAELLGGKEKLDSRIADLEKTARAGNSGELYFLLAYIQYKTEQSQQAKNTIDEAERKLPNDQLVKSLKSIIYQPPEK